MRHGRSIFFGIIASIVALAVPVQARVGVTSGSEGDPTGKPPVEAERVLRVGIDIQADELITTREDDRAHVVFLDGTSLTVGPNARIKIDKFVYDPNAKTGEIAISVVTGVFRVVGGKITKNQPIVVTTPSAVIGVRGGIALFEVSGQKTRAQFLFGKSMVVSARGHSETANRPGSEIVTRFGAVPGAAALVPAGGLTTTLGLLQTPAKSAKADETPDNRARQSGFSEQNSGRGIQSHTVTPSLPGAASNAISNAGLQKSEPSLPIAPPPAPLAAIPLPPVPPPVTLPPIAQYYEPWCWDGDRHRRAEHRNYRNEWLHRR